MNMVEYELLRETEKGVFTPTGETLTDDLATAEAACLDRRDAENVRFALVPYSRTKRVRQAEPVVETTAARTATKKTDTEHAK